MASLPPTPPSSLLSLTGRDENQLPTPPSCVASAAWASCRRATDGPPLWQLFGGSGNIAPCSLLILPALPPVGIQRGAERFTNTSHPNKQTDGVCATH